MEFLPNEIVFEICLRLKPKDISNLALVCKNINSSLPSVLQIHRIKFAGCIRYIKSIGYYVRCVKRDIIASCRIRGNKITQSGIHTFFKSSLGYKRSTEHLLCRTNGKTSSYYRIFAITCGRIPGTYTVNTLPRNGEYREIAGADI